MLQQLGIGSVFNCCGPQEGAGLPPVDLLAVQLALPDHRNQFPLTSTLLDGAVTQALVLLEQHPALYLHCWAGIERSPLLAVALLCRSEGLDLFTALAQVRQACPQARPLRHQLVVLESWLDATAVA
jgi:protein-tyrosine phosphatase